MQLLQLYFRISLTILLLGCIGHTAFAQRIISEQIVPVRGYDVYEVGYPFGVINVGNGRFAYVQYWQKSKMHPADNYYLQCLSYSNFEGVWYQPVMEFGRDRFQMEGVHRLGKSLVISGKLFLPATKTYQTVFRYFDTEGKPVHNGAIQVSNWEVKNKVITDEMYRFSPNNKRVLWLAKNNGKIHCSALDENGKKLWEQALNLPHVDKKYAFKDAAINNEGYPIFLLEQAKPHLSLKDTTYPPLVVRYHPKREKYHTDTLWLDSAFSYQTEFKLLNNQELIVAGIYGRYEEAGLFNGAKFKKNADDWDGFFCKKLTLINTDSTIIEADSLSPMPESWLNQYGEEGCNFSDFKIEVIESKKGKHAVWVMEEAWTDKKRVFFYDIGCVAFDLESGKVKWAKRLPKRQRGQGGASLLSYYSEITSNHIHFVYLSERGARGKLMATSFELSNGTKRDFKLASNEAATYLFFPQNSGKVANGTAVLIGMGNPGQNDYKLMTIRLE